MFIRPCVPKKDGTAAIGLYLPEIQEIMQFDQPTLKSTVAKGGNTKIAVDFLGKKKGAIEIPRTIINGEMLNEFEKLFPLF